MKPNTQDYSDPKISVSPDKLLQDVEESATCTRAHMEIFWTLASEARKSHIRQLNHHPDFFMASQDAHYTAFVISLGHLYDETPKTSSIGAYLRLVSNDARYEKCIETYEQLRLIAPKFLRIRNATVAHKNARLSEKDIVKPLDLTWNDIREFVYNSTSLVEELLKIRWGNDVALPIPRRGRLSEATIRLIESCRHPDSRQQ